MKISTFLMIGTTAAVAGMTTPVLAGDGAGPGNAGRGPGMQMHGPAGSWQGGGHRWGPRHDGRWYAGWRAPGGWGAYRRPVYGYVLPRYWVNPVYHIVDYRTYGLPAPAAGYGWSRYYDDAVMTDRYGRIYDYRSDLDWDRYDGGEAGNPPYARDSRERPRRDDGAGGAAIGAVVGGIAGNRIAGRGNRTAGTLIGAGAGAVAGLAIDRAEDRGRRDGPPPHRPGAPYDDGYDYGDDSVTTRNEYDGRWSGTWTTDDGRKVSGTYEGRFEGDVRGAGVDYAAPPYPGGPYPAYPAPAGGYIAGGYYYPAPIVTTVTVQPAVTTTTTVTYVTEKVPARRHVRRRTSCHCK